MHLLSLQLFVYLQICLSKIPLFHPSNGCSKRNISVAAAHSAQEQGMYSVGNIGNSCDKDSVQAIARLIASERLPWIFLRLLINIFTCNCSPCLTFQSLPLLPVGNAELAISYLDMDMKMSKRSWRSFSSGFNDTSLLLILLTAYLY